MAGNLLFCKPPPYINNVHTGNIEKNKYVDVDILFWYFFIVYAVRTGSLKKKQIQKAE